MQKRKFFITRLVSKVNSSNPVKESSFDSSSIADLAFLLLIFFIVTSSFILPQGLNMTLPSKSSKAIKVNPNKLIEIYPRKKDYFSQGKVLSKIELKELFKKRMEEQKEIIAKIHMPNQLPYKRLVDTINIAKSVGIKKISLKEVTK